MAQGLTQEGKKKTIQRLKGRRTAQCTEPALELPVRKGWGLGVRALESMPLPVEGLTSDGDQGMGSRSFKCLPTGELTGLHWIVSCPWFTQILKLLNPMDHKQNRRTSMWETDLWEGLGRVRGDRRGWG